MHELSLACSLVDLACQRAQEEGASRITALEVEVGALAGVMREALAFGFEAACRDTLAQGARLVIIEEPAKGVCSACRVTCRLARFTITCPACGAAALEISGGDRLCLRAIEVA